MVNARAKGNRAEKAWRDHVEDYLGVKVRKPQPGTNGDDGQLGPFSQEVKHQETVKLREWVKQAEDQANSRDWILALRWNRYKGWLVVMDSKTFFRLAREEIVETANTATRWQTGDGRLPYGPANLKTCSDEQPTTPETNAVSDDLRASEWGDGYEHVEMDDFWERGQ
jgi:hypothetical protein